MNTIFIGIAGGTGSGKTTLTEHLKQHFGDDQHDEADQQNRTGFEHVDLGGHAQHGEREEEAGAQRQGDADGAKIIRHENGA